MCQTFIYNVIISNRHMNSTYVIVTYPSLFTVIFGNDELHSTVGFLFFFFFFFFWSDTDAFQLSARTDPTELLRGLLNFYMINSLYKSCDFSNRIPLVISMKFWTP